jgi:enoyl-CoA hydratase
MTLYLLLLKYKEMTVEMALENITTEVKNEVLIITINRPDKLNALNKQTIEELHETFVDAENNKDIRALIITGSGQKAFVAGADIAEFANFSVEEGKQLSSIGHFKIFNFIENYSKPVIDAQICEDRLYDKRWLACHGCF